jgi:hypothetical protein
MKKIIAVAAILMLCGCAMGSVKQTLPNGTVNEASYGSLFKNIGTFEGDLAKGKVSVTGSDTNIDALKAVTDSAVRSAIGAVTK